MPFQLIIQPILLGIYAHYSLFMNNVNIINYPKLYKGIQLLLIYTAKLAPTLFNPAYSLLFIYVISLGPSDMEHYVEGSP